jgi:positive regulator of sigma E activity
MKSNSIERTGIKYGVITGVTLILFFFVMKMIGLIQNYELRALNGLFLLAGVYLAIKDYSKDHNGNTAYLGGLGAGLLTSGISLFIFAWFVVIYLSNDTAFMESIKQTEYFGEYLNPYIAGAAIFLEGTLSGFLLSFIFMQFYKKSHLSKTEKAKF